MEEIVNVPRNIEIMVFVTLQMHTQIWACKMCDISLLCSVYPESTSCLFSDELAISGE